MVDDDGDAVATLQIAQIGEQRGDLAADVFIDAVQPHEWVEDEQARLQPDDGFVEAGTVGIEVEAQARSGDDLDVEVGQVEAGRRYRCRRAGGVPMCSASSAA